MNKVEDLQNIAAQMGWKTQIVPEIPDENDASKIEWRLYCLRDKETMYVLYIGKAFQEAKYTYGDYSYSPPRSGAVRKLLVSEPDPKRLANSGQHLLDNRSVPWDSEASALEIMVATLGANITWVRTWDKETESSFISKEKNLGSKHFCVKTTKSGNRNLCWVDNFGFRAVNIDSIVDVQ